LSTFAKVIIKLIVIFFETRGIGGNDPDHNLGHGHRLIRIVVLGFPLLLGES